MKERREEGGGREEGGNLQIANETSTSDSSSS